MSGKGNALAEKLEDATDGKKKKKTRCARSLSPSLPLSPSLSLSLNVAVWRTALLTLCTMRMTGLDNLLSLSLPLSLSLQW